MLVLLRGGEDDDNFFERFVIFFFHRSRVHRALDLDNSITRSQNNNSFYI
jgi:hypothetical protein